MLGVKYTIKEKIIYDAKVLIEDMKAMVERKKEETDFDLKQPGAE